MFEAADLEHRVSKAAYKRAEPKLRRALLDAQYDLYQDGSFAVLILIAGVDGAGRGATIHLLNGWMDPRHILTHGFADLSDEERERPQQRRFWRAMPPKGKVGVFFGAWHTEPILRRAQSKMSAGLFEQNIDEILRLEKMLCDEGVAGRFNRREKLAFKRFKITPEDWRNREKWDDYEAAVCDMVERTSNLGAPWTLVEANNKYFARVKVLKTLCAALEAKLS